MVALQSSLLQVALMASLLGAALGFKPLFSLDGQSVTHRDITERAVLQKTAEACQDLAAARGQDFVMPASLSALSVQGACSPAISPDSLLSTVSFQTSIVTMCLNNAAVDLLMALSEEHHFDSETFQRGRDDVITAGVYAVKASVKMEDFVSGRLTLGRVCHTLQDFYSHSNWVELGNSVPYSALTSPDQALHNLADPSVPTCSNCTGENCNDNLLPELLQQGLLTSGYFSIFSSAKPTGKCSHGGFLDRTSRQDPVGGINKDDVGADHGHLHRAAAELAVGATRDLLEDIRTTVGDRRFLQLMGVSQATVLCFVIDTTGSMSDDIAEAKRVSFAIIDGKRGTPLEPSAYILVPFNDPTFGPLIRTTDADVFKASINILDAVGGGDIPEMSLSGLQLALTAAPSSTEIFVFTDAPAKDTYLKGAVMALIESTKSVVTFMLTDALTTRRRRRASMSHADLQLYRELAQASGGQVIEVTKSSLPSVTAVIGDALAPAVVTIAQETRTPGRPGNFTFRADGLLRSLTAYITGPPSLTCTVRSPTGGSQACAQTSGPLGSFSSVGNLLRLSLNATNQTGLWEISVSSSGSYSVKVIGQSSLNFIYSLVEMGQGALGNFSPKEGRSITGGNMTLLVTVTGSDMPKVTQVTLVEASGSQEVNGSVQSLGSGTFLVAFTDVPAGRFLLRLSGEDSATSCSFQRQASTQIQTSAITVSVRPNTTSIEPGATISVPYVVTVASATGSGPLSVRATSDKGSASATPDSVIVAAATGQAGGTVSVTAPADAPLGSSLTLTVQVVDGDATGDSNYAVLRLPLVTKVRDTQRPQCQVVSVTSCPTSSSSGCSATQWQLFANVTDGSGGSGVQSVRVRHGNGTLNVTAGTEGGVAAVTYATSCCTQSVQLVAVDAAGNANTCELHAALAPPSGASGLSVPLPQLLWVAVALPWQWVGGGPML